MNLNFHIFILFNDCKFILHFNKSLFELMNRMIKFVKCEASLNSKLVCSKQIALIDNLEM